MNNKWNQSGNRFDIGSIESQKDLLDNGIYSLEIDARSGALYLERLQDQFDFGYKLYGIQSNFIRRAITTYHNTTNNLGILLNGIKGTGKSVTAKMLCNELNLPVILINKGYGGIPDFINSIQQEVIVFIDEFEKVFKSNDFQDNSTDLLTVMDGVLDNGYRRVFLLTTNQLRVNDNLIQRPGRVRYLKTFSDLDKETIEMIVDDCLIHTEHKVELIKFISKLELITVDIVKAVVTEVNIHNESPEAFKDVFNVKEKQDKYIVYEVDGEKLTKVKEVINIDGLLNDDYGYGYEFQVSVPNTYGTYCFEEFIDQDNLVFKARNNNIYNEDDPKLYKTFTVEKVTNYHQAYTMMY